MNKQTGTKTEPEAKRCECGCGAAVTRRFKPGHDQKLRGALVRAAKAGDAKAIAALREHGWPVPASKQAAEAKARGKAAAKVATPKADTSTAPKARKRVTRKPAVA